jgi:hypothetical protein
VGVVEGLLKGDNVHKERVAQIELHPVIFDAEDVPERAPNALTKGGLELPKRLP